MCSDLSLWFKATINQVLKLRIWKCSKPKRLQPWAVISLVAWSTFDGVSRYFSVTWVFIAVFQDFNHQSLLHQHHPCVWCILRQDQANPSAASKEKKPLGLAQGCSRVNSMEFHAGEGVNFLINVFKNTFIKCMGLEKLSLSDVDHCLCAAPTLCSN